MHTVDKDAVRRRLELTISGLDGFRAALPRTPNNLSLLASNAWDVVACGSVVAPNSPHIPAALQTASTALAALFAAADASPNSPVEVTVTGCDPIRYTSPPDNSLIHANRWLRAFWTASVADDMDSIGLLYRTEPSIFDRSSTRCPAYSKLFVEGIVDYLDAAPGTDVVICAHFGLDHAATLTRILAGSLIGATLRIEFQRCARESIPVGRVEREQWFFDHWGEVDGWAAKFGTPQPLNDEASFV